MKVIRTYDKATQKTHVTTISLISTMGPTVSEYDILPDVPAASASTVSSINNLGETIGQVGGSMTSLMSLMTANMQNCVEAISSEEDPPVNMVITTLNQRDTPISLSELRSNYKILRVILQATEALDENTVVTIKDNTNNADIALFEYSMFEEGLTYNNPVSIVIPSNCDDVTISSNTDKTINVSILYMMR